MPKVQVPCDCSFTSCSYLLKKILGEISAQSSICINYAGTTVILHKYTVRMNRVESENVCIIKGAV